MGLLDGKKLLVTGVLTDGSIAFHVARLAQQEGAEVLLTSFGRQFRLTQAISRRLPKEAPVLQLDVTDADDLAALADRVREAGFDSLDGVVHSIGFAPQSVMGGNFLAGEWDDVATALQVSAYSLKSLAVATQPLLSSGGAIVGLTFDARYAWPVYDWMGVAKAAFESTSRYLARDLGPHGIRVQPGLRRPDPHHGRQVDPRLRGDGGRLARARAARLGRVRPGADGPRGRGAAVRLVPGDHRRDRARRRRLPRDGSVTAAARSARDGTLSR